MCCGSVTNTVKKVSAKPAAPAPPINANQLLISQILQNSNAARRNNSLVFKTKPRIYR